MPLRVEHPSELGYTSQMPDSIQKLRGDAVAAFEAAVSAVQPTNLVPEALQVDGERISIRGDELPQASGRRVVAAIGKAAPGLSEAWLAKLPAWAHEMIVITPHGVPVPDRVAEAATVLRGAHPYPDNHGEAATRRLLSLAADLGENDLLVVLLSGGGSALMAAPEAGLSLEDVRATTQALLEAGAPIEDVNTVRRQLLAAAGGGLARVAAPARVVTLVLSDVLGDPLPAIASGPTVPSPTSAADASAVLDRHKILQRVPAAVVSFLSDLAGRSENHEWAELSRIQILANNRTAVDAAAAELATRGYRTEVFEDFLEGEASERGVEIADSARRLAAAGPAGRVVGGETTVTVKGSGRGGRNHELALAAAIRLADAPPCVVLAAGTDGVDGMAEAAGAVVDPTTAARLRQAGIDPEPALADNDAGAALAAVGDVIVTGPTGTNVCDITIVLAP
jgi:glycerate-2-kinase